MSDYREELKNPEHIRCGRCDVELVLARVRAQYLKSDFPTRVPCCPACGQIYISEKLAFSKIAEIEQTLEEK